MRSKINITDLHWIDILMEIYEEAPISVRSLKFKDSLTYRETERFLKRRQRYLFGERYCTVHYAYGRKIKVRFVELRETSWIEIYNNADDCCERIVHRMKIRSMRGYYGCMDRC